MVSGRARTRPVSFPGPLISLPAITVCGVYVGPTVSTLGRHWPNVTIAVTVAAAPVPACGMLGSEQSQLLHAQGQVRLWVRRGFWKSSFRRGD